MENGDKIYDLEERTLKFSKEVIHLIKSIPRNAINHPIFSQLIRSATSVGANYREANDALGKKDFAHCIKIARKEAKETIYWLNLLEEVNPEFIDIIKKLEKEAGEIRNILSAIIKKVM